MPEAPSTAPTFLDSETNTTTIRVLLDQVTEDGGSAITSYHLQRTEPGGSVFFDVIGSTQNQSLSQDIQVEGLQKRKGYRFRYRVYNKIGVSAWSPESYLVPAVVPS